MKPRLALLGLLRGSDHALSLAFAVTLLAGFALAKVIALKLGPAGVGLQSAVTATAVISAGLAMAGVASAVPLVAGTRPEVDAREMRRTVSKILSATMPLALIVGAWIGLRQLGQLEPIVLVAGVSMASLGWVLTNTRLTLLSTFGGSSATARHIVVSGVASASVTATIVLVGPPSALPLAVGVGTLAGPVLAVLTVRWEAHQGGGEGREHLHSGMSSAVSVREILAAGIHPFLGSLSALVALTALPVIVLSVSSATTAGFFRAGYSLGTAVPTIVIATITNSFYPRFAAAFEAREECRAIARQSLRAASSLVLPALLAVSFLSPLLLRIAFSAEFVAASGALVMICIASTVQALSNFAWFALFAAGKSRQCIVLQAIAMLVLTAAVGVGASTDNVSVVAAGYLLGWVLFLLLILRLASRELGDRNPLAVLRGTRLSAAWITIVLIALGAGTTWSAVLR